MQKIKLLFFVVALIFISAISIFAQNNSGYTRSINIGSSFPVVYNKDKYNFDNTYNIYTTVQAGYLFDFDDRRGVSVMGEVGYNFSAAANIYDISGDYPIIGNITGDITAGTYIHSVIVGVLPAFNINNFSIGIGGGVKIPISGVMSGTLLFEDEIFLTGGQEIDDDDISMTPYVKFVLDYSLFIDTKTSMVFTFNTGYDFKVGNELYEASPEAFHMGFQVGIKLGPKL